MQSITKGLTYSISLAFLLAMKVSKLYEELELSVEIFQLLET